NLLDLESRPGKAPGGYNYELSEVRLPFIFTNAVGRDDDVYTLLHESGHAFHTFATREAGLLFDYRGESIPSEFAEVASTAMEYNSAAQGAINVWLRYRKDPKDAVEAYRGSLSLGGSKPIPELFEAAGIPWDFGKGTVERHANELRRVLTSLEEAKIPMKG